MGCGQKTEYEVAKARYAEWGIDVEQADDVGGFEVKPEGLAGGGIMATGNHPSRAGVPAGADWIREMTKYEETVQTKRG